MRLSLADVDVIVPVRIDSPDRLENLDTALAYLGESFQGQRVSVLEHAPVSQAPECAAKHGADYHFVATDSCFHKSRVLNLGIALADRPYVLLYDCDVLFPPAALTEARQALSEGEVGFVYPYNGILLEIERARVRAARETGSGLSSLLAELPRCVPDRSSALPAGVQFLHGTAEEPSSGAALMANRRRLILAGGYNENIVSYGCEDTELATRLLKLDLGVRWLDGYSAYHVAHRRGGDSRYNNFHGANLAEWNKVRGMERDALEAYVRNGFRELRLDSRATLVTKNTATEFSLRLSAADAIALDDVAFVLPVPAATATLRAWVERFIARLDEAYDNFELYLVEIGGYGFQSSAHRDHVLYMHARSGGEADWLRGAVEHTTRALVCVCSPFTDVGPDKVLEAAAQVRSSPAAVASLPTRAPESAAARSDKVSNLVMRTLPVCGDALVFARESYLECTAAPVTSAPLDLGALRRRLEAAAASRRAPS